MKMIGRVAVGVDLSKHSVAGVSNTRIWVVKPRTPEVLGGFSSARTPGTRQGVLERTVYVTAREKQKVSTKTAAPRV